MSQHMWATHRVQWAQYIAHNVFLNSHFLTLYSQILHTPGPGQARDLTNDHITDITDGLHALSLLIGSAAPVRASRAGGFVS